MALPSVLWRCWLGCRKGIRPVKTEWWGAGVVVCLQQRDLHYLHMAQLMPLPLTVSCFTKTQIGFTFLVPAHLGSPGKRAVKWVCVCVCVCYGYKSTTHRLQYVQNSHKDSGHTPQIPHVMVTLTYENHALCSIGQILCVHWRYSSVILLLTWSLLAYSLAVIVCFVAT